MARGKFRQDLFFRLSSHPVELPPLRERMDDLPLLLQHFIEEALQEVVGMLHQQFRKRGTEIDQTLAAALPAIPVDADKMKQVFLNLLMNAHQALEGARGRIRVATAFDPGRNTVEISIADSGPGIPPAIVDKIFDPFFSTKQSGEGTGLGLSVSYGIVTDHGGTIEVGTTADDMTEFIVRLPALPRQGDEP